MSKKRRVVTVVTEEPEGGRPRLRAFGRGTIAALSGVPLEGVKRAIRRKEFDQNSLKSTMDWITAQKSRLAFPNPPPPNEQGASMDAHSQSAAPGGADRGDKN